MMFEVQDLAVASPATVSRCGMVYLEPSILGLSPFVTCWLQQLPDVISPYTDQLEKLFEAFLDHSIRYIKQNTKEFAHYHSPSTMNYLYFLFFKVSTVLGVNLSKNSLEIT